MDSSQAPTHLRPLDFNAHRTPFSDPDNHYTYDSTSSDPKATQSQASSSAAANSDLVPRSTSSHRTALLLAVNAILIVLFLVGLCVLAQVLRSRRRRNCVVGDGDSMTKGSEEGEDSTSASETGPVDKSAAKGAPRQANFKSKWRSVWSTLCDTGGYKFPMASCFPATDPTPSSRPTAPIPQGFPLSNYYPSSRSYTFNPSYELATFPHLAPYPQVYYNHHLFAPNQSPPQIPRQVFDDAPLDPPQFYQQSGVVLPPPVYQPHHQYQSHVHARSAHPQQQEMWTWSAANGFQPFLGDHHHPNLILNGGGAQQSLHQPQ